MEHRDTRLAPNKMGKTGCCQTVHDSLAIFARMCLLRRSRSFPLSAAKIEPEFRDVFVFGAIVDVALFLVKTHLFEIRSTIECILTEEF